MPGGDVSLGELLEVSIDGGVVNFGALRELLGAVLTHLDLRQVTVRWPDPDPLGPGAGAGAGPPGGLLARVRSCEEDVSRVRVQVPPPVISV